jgi:hypothetical protein
MADIIPGIGGISMPDPLSVTAGITNVMYAVILISIMAAIVMLGYKKKIFWKFPTKFEVLKVEGGTVTGKYTDYGRRVVKKKNGVVTELYYDIKNANFHWIPPSYANMVPEVKAKFDGNNIPSGKGKSTIFVKELSHNAWEVINLKDFVTGTKGEYDSIGSQEADSYFKNTTDDMIENKFKLSPSKWKPFIDALPILMSLLGIGLFFYFFGTYILVPTLDRGNAAHDDLAMAQQLLNQSTQYVEMLLRLNGYQTVNGTVIIK